MIEKLTKKQRSELREAARQKKRSRVLLLQAIGIAAIAVAGLGIVTALQIAGVIGYDNFISKLATLVVVFILVVFTGSKSIEWRNERRIYKETCVKYGINPDELSSFDD